MKKLYVLIAVTTLFINMQAQTFDWAKREGLWAYDYGYGITTDNMGNVYVAGKYEQDANFSGTILPCPPPDCNHDIWVAQYSSTGTLNWIRTAGGQSGDYAWDIACDNSFLYVAGEIEGVNETIYFPGSPITLTCQASNDIFVAKYDLTGNLLWARRAGDDYYDKALGVTYDNSGNVYICGLYNTKAVFGGTTTINSVGQSDIFIAKYDASGTFLWVMSAGSTGRDEAKSIKCDAAGNIYVSGMYSQGCVFPGEPALTTYNNTNWYDSFLTKISPDGVVQWVKTSGGDFDDVAWGVTLDNAGKIYIAGEYNGYASFNPSSTIALTTSGMADVFVACYDASGNVQWAKSAGGPLVDRARGIGTDGTNIVITGQFGSTASFGLFPLTAADSSDIFFACLDNFGNFIAASSVGGPADSLETLGYESGIAICAEANGNVYATGSLLDGGVFGSTSYTEYGRTDVFVTKISQLTGVGDLVINTISIPVYPNPSTGNFTFDVRKLSGRLTETTVFNYLGQVVNTKSNHSSSEINIDLSNEQKGVYFVEIKDGDRSVSRGKIVLQ